MEGKLEEYRARKRRKETVNTLKEKLIRMLPFHHNSRETSSASCAIDTTESDPTEESGKKFHLDDDNASLTSETESLLSNENALQEEQEQYAGDDDDKCMRTVLRVVYILFWATCYAIAIELGFGIVYLLFSALFGVYFNTRTAPKRKDEVSAYSVFNKDFHAIDGTLKAEQFEREIRYGAASVR